MWWKVFNMKTMLINLNICQHFNFSPIFCIHWKEKDNILKIWIFATISLVSNILYPIEKKMPLPYLRHFQYHTAKRTNRTWTFIFRWFYFCPNFHCSNVDGGQYWICRENYLIVNLFSEAEGGGVAGRDNLTETQ